MADEPSSAHDAGQMVAVVADLADLPLAPERIDSLAELVATVREEQSALRGIEPDVQPSAVFDPRWD